MTLSSTTTLRLWGVLDLLQLAWYSVRSLQSDRTPYLTDLLAILGQSEQVGDMLASVGLLAWCLELSIAITAVGFLLGYRPTRLLGFAQIPLRLFFLSPSISPLLLLSGHLPGLLFLVLVIGSEALKGWSLWRRTL